MAFPCTDMLISVAPNAWWHFCIASWTIGKNDLQFGGQRNGAMPIGINQTDFSQLLIRWISALQVSWKLNCSSHSLFRIFDRSDFLWPSNRVSLARLNVVRNLLRERSVIPATCAYFPVTTDIIGTAPFRSAQSMLLHFHLRLKKLLLNSCCMWLLISTNCFFFFGNTKKYNLWMLLQLWVLSKW